MIVGRVQGLHGGGIVRLLERRGKAGVRKRALQQRQTARRLTTEVQVGTIALDSLVAALGQLEEGLVRFAAEPEDLLLRDGVIQRFEYTMDLCWKLLQRYLRHIAQVPDADMRTKRDLFRQAAVLGLVEDPELWFAYYDARNMTSHSYDGAVAREIVALAAPFAVDAHRLLKALHDAA